jgi:hypothetical protein
MPQIQKPVSTITADAECGEHRRGNFIRLAAIIRFEDFRASTPRAAVIAVKESAQIGLPHAMHRLHPTSKIAVASVRREDVIMDQMRLTQLMQQQD